MFTEISKIVHLSTAHLSMNDVIALDIQSVIQLPKKLDGTTLSPCLVITKYREGYIINVPDKDDQAVTNVIAKKFSKGVSDIFKACAEHGIDYVKFDADAPVSKDYPVHDWN